MELQLIESEQKIINTLKHGGIRDYLRTGDLSAMPDEVKDYILVKMCAHFGLDPILRPFQLIELKRGGLVWYATKSATDQIASKLSLTRSFSDVKIDTENGIASMIGFVRSPEGREESALAAVPIAKFGPPQKGSTEPVKIPLTGEEFANAMMKLQTKAFRRATLAYIGMFDHGEEEQVHAPRVRLSEQINSIADLAAPEEVPDKPRRGRPKKDDVVEVSTQSVAPVVVQQSEDPLSSVAQPQQQTEEAKKPEDIIYNREKEEHKTALAKLLIKLGFDFSNPTDAKLAGQISSEASGAMPIFAAGSTDLHPDCESWIIEKRAALTRRSEAVL